MAALSSHGVNTTRPTTATLLILALALLVPALSASAKPPSTRRSGVNGPALRRSEQLWATIDVCNPGDQPDTVGIRGSMPGDGQPHDTMYMHFRLQYMSTRDKRWVDLSNGAQNGFVALGSAKAARQTGWSFRLASGQPMFQLRGVVTFQWRHGATVVYSLSRPTTAGHHSLAGADPRSFSAAVCTLT
jgi:hypothetical protein